MIYCKKLNDLAGIPKKGTPGSAGWDIRAALSDAVRILPGEVCKIPTGLAFAIPDGLAGLVYARSGLSLKCGLRPANCVGVIDSDYRGEVMVPLYNDSDKPQTVNPGDRIAQILFSPVSKQSVEMAYSLDETERGEGGFGSTGVS